MAALPKDSGSRITMFLVISVIKRQIKAHLFSPNSATKLERNSMYFWLIISITSTVWVPQSLLQGLTILPILSLTLTAAMEIATNALWTKLDKASKTIRLHKVRKLNSGSIVVKKPLWITKLLILQPIGSLILKLTKQMNYQEVGSLVLLSLALLFSYLLWESW